MAEHDGFTAREAAQRLHCCPARVIALLRSAAIPFTRCAPSQWGAKREVRNRGLGRFAQADGVMEPIGNRMGTDRWPTGTDRQGDVLEFGQYRRFRERGFFRRFRGTDCRNGMGLRLLGPAALVAVFKVSDPCGIVLLARAAGRVRRVEDQGEWFQLLTGKGKEADV